MIGLDPDDRSRELPSHERDSTARSSVPPARDEASCGDDAWDDDDDWEDWLFL